MAGPEPPVEEPFRREPPTDWPDGPSGPAPRIPLAWQYALIGAVLGVGAPAGALLLRLAGGAPAAHTELSANAFFYLYELVGSCLVFGAAGFYVGHRADRLRSGRDLYRTLSEHDALTGLINARAFRARYRRAIEHARRFQEPLSLLIVYVDRLKEWNDTYGHPFGSQVLLHVAHALTACTREDDMAARWGGDEFALLMPGADAPSARQRADAVCEKLRNAPLVHNGVRRSVSVTIGVATRAGGTGEEAGRVERDLFERADQALLEGKRIGRGQVRESL